MRRLAVVLLLLSACGKREAPAPAVPGNAERGRSLISQYGCNVCHIIPGISGPQGAIGPSLEGLASRPAIGNGAAPNTHANLAKFIRNPASVNPSSNMPPIALTDADAQDVAAYLVTLR